MDETDRIKTLIAGGAIDEALAACQAALQSTSDSSAHAHIYYLMGNAHRKREDWQKAMNAYQQAIDIDPHSPAATARKMITEILNYYYKDQFNQ